MFAIYANGVYNDYSKARAIGGEEKPFTKGSEEMPEEMNNAQFDTFLETLARLVEAKAETVEQAAEIIRNAKTQ